METKEIPDNIMCLNKVTAIVFTKNAMPDNIM